MSEKTKKDIQVLVGNTLRFGVWLAFGITLLGLLLFLAGHSTAHFDTTALHQEPAKFSLSALREGLLSGYAPSIIYLGVIVLLATPILRLLFALYGYWQEHNRLYVLISIIVLSIIAGSLLIGATH